MYAPYAPNCDKANGFSNPSGPAICCIRLNCLSFSVSANLTTKLEDAPCENNEGEIRLVKILQESTYSGIQYIIYTVSITLKFVKFIKFTLFTLWRLLKFNYGLIQFSHFILILQILVQIHNHLTYWSIPKGTRLQKLLVARWWKLYKYMYR